MFNQLIMKKFLLFIFFLLFVSVIFIWDHELTAFWLDPANRTFLITELVTWMEKYSPYLDILHMYRYPILIIWTGIFILSFTYKRYKKYEKRKKNEIFTGKKVIFDANDILSKESLPESEKIREKKRKDGPALIEKKWNQEEQKIENPEDDLDHEAMDRILNKH